MYKSAPLTTEEFIKRARERFSERFNYHYVEYYSMHTEVKITCPAHDMFRQKPINHFTGAGCPDCSSKSMKLSGPYRYNKYINKAKSIHKEKYDYTKTQFENYKNNVIISCIDCLCDININPIDHLHGFGCTGCWNDK